MGHSPQFSAHVYCGQTAGCIGIPFGTEVYRPRLRRRCVRWGLSSPKRGHAPQFSAHIHCGQTVAHLSYCWALVLLAYLSVLRLTYTSNILG